VATASNESRDDAFAALDVAPKRILQAAIECMRQYGSLKMSMAGVAKSAGCSRATVYKYFRNRQELIDAVVDQGRLVFFVDLESTVRDREHLSDQMVAAVARVMEYLHDDSNVPWAGLLDPLDQAIITRDRGAELMDGLSGFATRLVRAAADRGEVRPDLDPASVGEWFGHLLFSSHFNEPTAESIEHAQHVIRDLCAAVAADCDA
jgi:AcrR family transcriptional regulator